MSQSQPKQGSGRVRGNPVRNTPLPQNERKDVGSTVVAVTTVPDVTQEDLNNWMTALYDVSKVTDEDLKSIWDAYSYKGFNRDDVLKQLSTHVGDVRMTTHLIILIALRGPQAASTIKMINGKTPLEMGIPASGGQGSKFLTCNKIQAATADLAAYYLKKLNAPKRLNMSCPGWLQFPSAGSIKMPEEYRRMHLEFTTSFSSVIGGIFQPQIYEQMVRNAYLADHLNLFTG